MLFYGHFPDRLLVQSDPGLLGKVKQTYRQPFDAIESWSTGCADDIVVNSKFTRAVFKKTFASMRSRDLKVIYPCVDTTATNTTSASKTTLWPGRAILLSINRFERKKDINLALKGFAGLSSRERASSKLVIAGGYDDRVQENAQTLKELENLADNLEITRATFRGNDTAFEKDESEIVFLLSVPEDLKRRLFAAASLLLYTPRNEHFGIVPLEAMLAKVPVLATNSGGPLETIYDGRTGWLRSPEKIEQWTDVMRKPLIPSSADTLSAMGVKGRERVLTEFSHTKMTDSLEQEVQKLCATTAAKRPKILAAWGYALVLVGAVAAAVVAVTISYFILHYATSKDADGSTY